MSWQQLSRWLSFLAALIGAVSLVGWLFDFPALTRLSPDLVTMKVNTAICLILAGTAVWFIAAETASTAERIVPRLAGTIVFLVGGLTLMQHLFNLDFGIDQALVVESVESAGRSFPGRMGPTSALIFMGLGGSICALSIRTQRGFRISQALALGASALNFAIFLGYFYHVQFPPSLEKYFSIALHTVIAFALLLWALLLARPRSGGMAILLADDAGGSLARRLLPSAILVPAISGWIFVLGRERGFYGNGVPAALLAACITLVFTWLVWNTAKAIQRSERNRKDAENKLAQSERQLSDFFDNASVALHWVGPDGTIIRVNDTELSMLGYTREEYVGQSITKFHACPITIGNILERLTGGETLTDYPAKLVRKDGSLCEVLIHSSVYRENGNFVHTRCFTRNVTDYNQMVRALQDSEDRYRAFITNSSEGIWRLEFDPPIDTTLSVEDQLNLAYGNGRFAECNEVMARMYGFSEASELVGQSLNMMLPAADPDARAFLSFIIGSGYRADDIESTERDANGNPVYFSNSMVGVVEDGLLKRIWGTQRDMTERKKAQDALVDSEQKFRGMFTNAAVGMALVDLDGKWLQINDRVCAITGYERIELLGKDFGEITHPEDLETDWSHAGKLLRGEINTYSMEKRYLHKNGDIVWVNLTVSLQQTHDGEPHNFISVIEDITDRKKTARALSESMEEATRSRHRAEAASRAKDDFLATLSHELRTPLTPVLMSAADLATDERLPEDVREQITMIGRNVTLEARLIDDLLDLTRIMNRKLTMRHAATDAHALMHHTCQIIQAEMSGRNLDLSFDLVAGEHFVMADAGRLQQVFWNLLKNAVKFTPDGGKISVRTENPTIGKILITVTDTGRGILAENLDKIFEPFEQGSLNGSHSFGGLGLGLSISKALIGLHEGKLQVTSQGHGKGAAFTVELDTMAEQKDEDPQAASVPQMGRRGIRILFVEDDESTRATATRLLRRRGYLVQPASTVKEALDLCREQDFDLLVTDIGLPDGTGISLMERIRDKYGIQGIALSGYGMEHDMNATAAAGFSAHLIKPIKIEELTALIDSM